MSYIRKGRQKSYSFREPALLAQAGPVQNTWYTILEASNVRLIDLQVAVWTTGETLELKITANGVVITYTQAAVASTAYYPLWDIDPRTAVAAAFTLDTTPYLKYKAFFMEAETLKIEIRKTTANGVGTLYGKAIYQTM